ncbi:MAG: outer membrane lipoprotein-sorting protein [bacterium]
MMKKLIFNLVTFTLILPLAQAQNLTGKEILQRVDNNMSSENRIFKSKMIVHGPRGTRTIESKTWSVGEEKAFTEYLYPAREKGTKMLKLDDQLWIFSPSTDRTIQIAGHMLRQSVMGSDMSYEDMMDDASLTEKYNAEVKESEMINDRSCYVVNLTAKTSDVNYFRRVIWIDSERFVPLKEELYAESGKLLKKTELFDIVKMKDRWFPKKIIYKDMLKKGDGTEFVIADIQSNVEIPEYIFNKGNLRK